MTKVTSLQRQIETMRSINARYIMAWLDYIQSVKRQVRRGVFETNSSSVHSICIATESTPHPKKVKTPLEIRFGDYGWQTEFYDTPSEKISYLVTALYDSDVYSIKETDDLMHTLLEWLRDEGIGYHIDIRKDLVEYHGRYYFDINGYVDHAHECKPFLDYVFASKENMWQYLFSMDSYVVTGNDNEDESYEYVRNRDVGYPHITFEKGN